MREFEELYMNLQMNNKAVIVLSIFMLLCIFGTLPIAREASLRLDCLSQGEQLVTLLTWVFVHNSLVHLNNNLFIFMLVGLFLLRRELTCCQLFNIIAVSWIGSTLLSILCYWNQPQSLLGSSGIAWGVITFMTIKYPRHVVIEFLTKIPIRIWHIIGYVVAIEVFSFVFKHGYSFGLQVAYAAHVGGVVAIIMYCLIEVLIRESKNRIEFNKKLEEH